MPVPMVQIHMACNNPDNGDFAGRVAQIDVQSGALELTARGWSITSFRGCPKHREDTSRGRHVIYLAGKPFQYHARKSWIGNWCWDGYSFTAHVATNFLVWLHRRALFRCEGGWVELCEAWDKPAPLVLPDEWWKA